MANVKEIQDRIKSIQDTMKITNAMYMISSSKMKKAKKALSDTEPYFFEMQSAIRRILRHVPDIEHAFFDERPEIPKKDRKIGHIIVTADKAVGRKTQSVCSWRTGSAVFFKENTAGRVCGYGFPLYGSEAFHAPCPYDRAAYGRGISGRKTG